MDINIISAVGAGLLAFGAYLLYTWSDERRRLMGTGIWHELSWTEAYLELAVSVAMIVAGVMLVIGQ